MSDFYHPIATTMQDFFSIIMGNGPLLLILIGLVILLIVTLLRLSDLKSELKKTKTQRLLADEQTQTAEHQIIQYKIRAAKLITLLKNEKKHSAEKLAL
ncbi:MAG: hypothetical protein KAI39_00640, partial [Desulfobulbaceae bacterium]|nr:hypothetical protein [Desulfobulbaceae bacterium]